ncbi:hypothetical protein HUW46_08163 [Amycolatopsis sp. CA-230715]|nr:hypothetical protein HUW46_08163 [Amycolatopsis sp. CA-230715]
MVDIAVAVLTFAMMCAVGSLFKQPQWRWFDGWAYVLTALICLPLAVRRVWPVLTLIVTLAAYLVFVLRGHVPGLHLWGPVLALYSVAALKPTLVIALGAAVTAPTLYVGSVELGIPSVAAAAQVLVVVLVAWVLGDQARQLDDRNRRLVDATEELRREHERNLEHTVTQERVRIARELHDVIAHHMSVISMQAGLSDYVFDTDPPTARGAVRTIGRVSREALDDMRRLLALLRVSGDGDVAGEPWLSPAPGLDQLPDLLARLRAAGQPVELSVRGAVGELPSGVQLAIYRVIQEALTNVVKHAGSAAPATVEVCREQDRVTVTVADEGSSAPSSGSDGGFGLLGMRERAKLYGGSLTARARPEGGFVVELVIPVS